MSTINVVKTDTGDLDGLSPKDKRAWRRFKAWWRSLEAGECFPFAFWVPRSPRFHRLHFAMLGEVYEAQEPFDDFEDMRMWLQVGAGHCQLVPGANGQLVAVPRSIAYHKLDDAAFSEHHNKVKDFLRGEHARRFLWPHLSEEQTYETVEILLQGFDR